jgi:hypothetical protein
MRLALPPASVQQPQDIKLICCFSKKRKTMFNFTKATHPDQQQEKQKGLAETETEGRQLMQSWIEGVSAECKTHLQFVATMPVNAKLDEAIESGDLQGAIALFCGAVDGSEEQADTFFKPFEEIAAEYVQKHNSVELYQYTKIRKLQHRLQLRIILQTKLSMAFIVPEERDRIRKQYIEKMLIPEFGETI